MQNAIEFPIIDIVAAFACEAALEKTFNDADKEKSPLYKQLEDARDCVNSFIISRGVIGKHDTVDGFPEMLRKCEFLASLHQKLLGSDPEFFSVGEYLDNPKRYA